MQSANPLTGKAFRGPRGEERAHRAGAFLRAAIYGTGKAVAECREEKIPLNLAETQPEKGFIRIKATGESVNTVGGFLAPIELQQEILTLRNLAGVFRKYCRVIPLGSDSRTWPRRTGGLTASFQAENTAIVDSTATFDGLTFALKKLTGMVKVPSELYEDETVGLAQWFAEELAWAFASKEDDCGFNGDGTSTYSGMRGIAQLAIDGNHNAGKFTASANTFGALVAADIAGLMGLLPEYAAATASFYVSNIGAANCFYRLAQTSGALGSIIEDGEIVVTYLGFPIRLTPKLPAITTTLTGKAMMFFGDLRLAAAIGSRSSVTVRTSDQRFLDTDQIAVRGTERFDLVVHDVGDNVTAGPIVALVAP